MENLKQKYPRASEIIVKIFAVLGLVIILLIAIYGALAAVRSIPNVWQSIGNAFNSVTSIFTGGDDLNLKSTPQTPVSGDTITISWKARGLTDGFYTFDYDCVEGVNFEILSPSEETRAFAFCNSPTQFSEDKDSVRVVATVLNENVVKVPVRISFTRDGEDDPTATGTMDLSIINSGNIAETPGNNNGNGNNNNSNTGNSPGSGNNKPPVVGNNNGVLIPGNNSSPLVGYSDLVVRVLDTGTYNKATGVYTPGSYLKSSDTIAIRFEVANMGTNVSDSWRFNATLPTNPSSTYPAFPQQSLRPGDRIQYTLGFDYIKPQALNQIVITIDPENTVRESNETNNSLIHNILLSNFSDSSTQPGYPNCKANTDNSYTCWNGNVRYDKCFLNLSGYTCYGNNTRINDDREDAKEAIEDAKEAIDEAEDEIDEAEDDNIDTNEAEELLDDARDALDNAEEAYDEGDYDEAIDSADEAEDLADEAIEEL